MQLNKKRRKFREIRVCFGQKIAEMAKQRGIAVIVSVRFALNAPQMEQIAKKNKKIIV